MKKPSNSRKASTKRSQQRLPKLERLIVDADVNAIVAPYLVALGFDVVFAPQVDVDVTDDTAILIWARRHRRIVVTHDRFSDRKTKIKLFQEIYARGGQAIQIAGGPSKPPLLSAAKVIMWRSEWLDFFKENDGIMLLYEKGVKRHGRAYLKKNIQGIIIPETEIPLKAPKRKVTPRPRARKVPVAQAPLL